jgi:RecQ family ATP-dependent DNA helicase
MIAPSSSSALSKFGFGKRVDDASLSSTLLKYFNYTSFRPHQLSVVNSILHGSDVFCMMATGSGKSMMFQLPALALRDNAGIPAVTIVISPLISLIEDQIRSLRERGITAIAIGSNSSREDEERAMKGDFTIIYSTPEKISVWKYGLESLQLHCRIVCIAIDEAHCTLEWGHDFRPAYSELGILRDWLPGIPILALTATATARIKDEIISSLRLRPSALIICSSFNRPNLKYSVINRTGTNDVVRVILNMEALYQKTLYEPRRINTNSNANANANEVNNINIKDVYASTSASRKYKVFQSTLVYVTTKKEAESVAQILRSSSRLKGVGIEFYHAGMTTEARHQVQLNFQNDTTSIVVATVAFGMGIHKDDIRLVVHLGIPQSVEAYYQQTGRSGRDGNLSHCVLLFHRQDVSKAFQVGTSGLPNIQDNNPIPNSTTVHDSNPLHIHMNKEYIKNAHDRVNKLILSMTEYCKGRGACRRKYLLAYFDEDIPHQLEQATDLKMQHPDGPLTSHCCDLCDNKLEKDYQIFANARAQYQREYQENLQEQKYIQKEDEEAARKKEKKEIQFVHEATDANHEENITLPSGFQNIGPETYLLLRSIRDSGQVYGLGVSIGLLIGSHDKNIQRIRDYAELWIFGRGAHRSREYWKALAEQLSEGDCTERDLLDSELVRGTSGTFAYSRYFLTAIGNVFLQRSLWLTNKEKNHDDEGPNKELFVVRVSPELAFHTAATYNNKALLDGANNMEELLLNNKKRKRIGKEEKDDDKKDTMASEGHPENTIKKNASDIEKAQILSKKSMNLISDMGYRTFSVDAEAAKIARDAAEFTEKTNAINMENHDPKFLEKASFRMYRNGCSNTNTDASKTEVSKIQEKNQIQLQPQSQTYIVPRVPFSSAPTSIFSFGGKKHLGCGQITKECESAFVPTTKTHKTVVPFYSRCYEYQSYQKE